METPKWWDETWDKRIKETGVVHNKGKLNRLLGILWGKHYLAPLEKLDIGCGPATHAIYLSNFNPFWKDRWTGIDLSRTALTVPRKLGFNVTHGSIFDFNTGRKFELFLLLDTLEHIQDHEALGQKIKDLAADKYTIIGNSPLYFEHNDGEERPIDGKTIARFIHSAGCLMDFSCDVYGIHGLPYANFEATNEPT